MAQLAAFAKGESLNSQGTFQTLAQQSSQTGEPISLTVNFHMGGSSIPCIWDHSSEKQNIKFIEKFSK